MSVESLKQLGHVMPLRGNANAGPRNTSTGPLGLSVVTIDAGRQMAEMECVFRPAGSHTQQMEALATLRRCGSSIRGWTGHRGSARARLEVSTQWLGRHLTVLCAAGKSLRSAPSTDG